MPNKILIPLQSLISCFLESPTNRQQWAQLRDSEEATLWYLPKALTRPRKSVLAAMDCAEAWPRGARPRSGAAAKWSYPHPTSGGTIENTLPNPHTYSQLIFDKGDKNPHWREDSLFSRWWWESWTFAAVDKSMKLEHSLTPCTKIP